MPQHVAYFLHPSEKYQPGITQAVNDLRMLLAEDSQWAEWELISFSYNDQNSFHVQPLYVRIRNKRGPIVLIAGVKKGALADLREKVGTLAVIDVVSETDPFTLMDHLTRVRALHEAGQPLISRKKAVAILLVRKMRRYHYWAGKDKGYIWHTDLAKGRGVDERYSDIIQEIANDLELHGILISKISKGQRKYALNPENKRAVHAIAQNGSFEDRLGKILLRDPNTVSAAVLYEHKKAQTFSLFADGTQFHHGGVLVRFQ